MLFSSGATTLFLLTDTEKQTIITCRVNRTPSISLWCDCRELLPFAGVQLTRLLARAFRPSIYISGQHWPPAPTGTVLNSTLCCTWISRKVLTNEGFLSKMQCIHLENLFFAQYLKKNTDDSILLKFLYFLRRGLKYLIT